MATITPMSDAELRTWVQDAVASMDGFSSIAVEPRGDRWFRLHFSGDGKTFYVEVQAATFSTFEAVTLDSNAGNGLMIEVDIGTDIAGLHAVYDGTIVTFSHDAARGTPNDACRCRETSVSSGTGSIEFLVNPVGIDRTVTILEI